MSFSETLNQYLKSTGCTAKELAYVSGLSTSAVSRYRTGERVPDPAQAEQLISGLCILSSKKEIPDADEESIRKAFSEYISFDSIDYELFSRKLDILLSLMNINVSGLARAMNFDSSYLSRIRTGKRRPADLNGFIMELSRYLVKNRPLDEIANFLGISTEEPSTPELCMEELRQWLSSSNQLQNDYLTDFLHKIDSFRIDRYVSIPEYSGSALSRSHHVPVAKIYYGSDEMKQGALDFFYSIISAKSKEPIYMFNNFSLEDFGNDPEYMKKWQFAIAAVINSGHEIHIIHDVNRPLSEMMIVLANWLPLYMTGKIYPYYLKGNGNKIFCHVEYVTGQSVLIGECLRGYDREGKYYLTRNKEELSYYKRRAERLFERAHPLVQVFNVANKDEFYLFEDSAAVAGEARHNILSGLPTYTIPEALLDEILEYNDFTDAEQNQVRRYIKRQKKIASTILRKSSITDDIPLLSEKDLEEPPVLLSLSGMFCEKDLKYTYAQYQQHLEATKEFALAHDVNYTLNIRQNHAFRNLQIQINSGKWIIISRNNAPTVHFVITHSRIVNAFDKFYPNP